MQKHLFFLLFVVAIGFSACKKSDSSSEFIINNIHDIDLTSTASSVLPIAIMQTSGTQEPVTISVSSLPSGVAATIDPVSGTPDFSVGITFKLTGPTTAGTYPIKITGTSSSYTKSYDLNLIVPAQAAHAQQVVGTWKTTQQGNDANNNGIWDASEHQTIPAADASTMLFNSNGTGTQSATLNGTLITIPFTWNLQNNDNDIRVISSFSGTNDTSIMTIISLSNTDWVLKDGTTTPTSFIALKK